jgi:CRP-like cAMP-binding protein
MRDAISALITSMLAGLQADSADQTKNNIEDLLQAAAALLGQVTVETYPSGVRLCTEGQEEDRFYIIAGGAVAIYKQIGAASAKELLATKGVGEFFGEMALVLNAPRSADVVTTAPSMMLEVDRRAFKKATRISPHLASLMSQRTIENLDANWHIEQNRRGPARRFTLFTSYSSRDRDFVSQLVEHLQQRLEDNNVDIWIDQAGIRGGDKWDRVIEEALMSCDAMLLMLSESSVASENVADEYIYYKEEKKPIIPIMIEKCARPVAVRRYQYIDFSRELYADGLAQLHARILELADE